MLELVFQLFNAGLEFVDQIVQLLRSIVANWCHCGRWIVRKDLTKVGGGSIDLSEEVLVGSGEIFWWLRQLGGVGGGGGGRG